MKKHILSGGVLLLTAFTPLLMTQCSKPEYPSPDVSNTNIQTTNVLFINALSDDSLLNFKIDNIVVQTDVTTGSSAGSPYNAIELGPRVIDAVFSAASTRSVGQGGDQASASVPFPFRTASSSTSLTLSAGASTLTGAALTAAGVALELTNAYIIPDGHFTVIAQGISGKRSKLILVDNITAPASGKAKIRLVNAAPSGVISAILDTAIGTAPIATVTGTVTGWTNIPTAAKAYNAAAATVQSFASVDASLNFAVYNGPAISTVSGVTTSATGIGSSFSVQSGGVYTLLVLKKNGAVTYSLIRHN